MTKWHPWARLFTCPTDAEGVRKDDLGDTVFNPVFSNKAKMIADCEGCADCDMLDECPGPVEYAVVAVAEEKQ
jgi:hypothetical protein